jgi:hypothetical protein
MEDRKAWQDFFPYVAALQQRERLRRNLVISR